MNAARAHVAWTLVPAGATAPGTRSLLDRVEQRRMAQLSRPVDRMRYLAAHTLLRLLVAELRGTPPEDIVLRYTCDTCGAPHGRPRSPGLFLSVSHAGAVAVAAASASEPVGVDVEPLQPLFPGFDETALHPAEQRALRTVPAGRRDEIRLRWWVRKEAILKARGVGLRTDPRTLAVHEPDGRWVDFTVVDDHLSSLALLGETGRAEGADGGLEIAFVEPARWRGSASPA